ncbi:MAG: hypothetical protein QME73_06280 [Bacillota bacterium]|nr:hypothetical protein [Bacillota bacterium]
MYKKLAVILIIITLALAGCSSGDLSGIIEEGDKQGLEEQAVAVETMKPDGDGKAEEGKQPVKADENISRTETAEAGSEQSQPTGGPLISKVETVYMFLDAWRDKDLERMDMLTLTPLETFFRNSDILFASYHYLDSGDIAGFVRDGLETLAVYDENALDNIEIESLQSDDSRLLVRLGEAFDMDITLEMDGNMWKLKMIDSLPAEMQKAVPEEWGSLNNSVLADLGDLNDDGNTEILTMGIWGEWEGMGPEPSSAIGIYSCRPQGLKRLFFKDTEERLNQDRVAVDGRIGVFDKNGRASIVILEKTAVDEIAALKSGEVKYYLSLYSLEKDKLEFHGDIDWYSIVLEWDVDKAYEPQWVELLGVHNLRDPHRSDVIVKVGFGARNSGERIPGIIEGLFILSNRSGEWRPEWSHIGKDGEYHDVVFSVPGGEDAAGNMYYLEDSFEREGAGSAYKVYYDGSVWKEEKAITGGGEIKAVSDMDGDGKDEFLVWEGNSLVILSDQGRELWRSKRLTGTREIPFAWMGVVDGRQRVIAALHQGSFASWKSQVFEWEGENYSLDHVWQSEELGSQGISAMHVSDIDRDGKPEILVNFSNDYLIRGQYFKIFEP